MQEVNKKTLWGVLLIFFGVLFFVKALNVLDDDNLLFNPRNYPVYAGVIFLCGRQVRIALVFFCISVVVWFDKIAEYIGNYSDFVWPLILILLGVLLIVGGRNGVKYLNQKRSRVVEDEDFNGNYKDE